MEMMIMAKQSVRPSSPTPPAFKTHKLSSIDQVMPSIYIPLIFFYENDESVEHDQISRRLKQSLSEILTIFYPLAGSIKQNSFVTCDDTGAQMVEARVQARLDQFIQNPKMEELEKLLPVNTASHNDDLILLVKVTYFDCGGISVGMCFSHKIADAASVATFMNAWGATCRHAEASRIFHPTFDLASHFPLGDTPPANRFITEEKITTERFVFDGDKIEKLRKASATPSNGYPSRVEAVSAFLWRNFNEAARAKLAACHTVNMRRRAVPPLPEEAFGNCTTPAIAQGSSSEEEDDEDELGVLVSKLRVAIRAIDDDYMRKVVKDNESYFEAVNEAGELLKAGYCTFSSWLRFPVYEVDFGWGKPVWVGTATMPQPNLVVLMDTLSGDGIEAWVNIPHHHFLQLLLTNFNQI